jgi:hypothetical protein
MPLGWLVVRAVASVAIEFSLDVFYTPCELAITASLLIKPAWATDVVMAAMLRCDAMRCDAMYEECPACVKLDGGWC